MSANTETTKGAMNCTDCAHCPAHNADTLVKLGIDMSGWDYVVALAGNPNTGKSTVFNALTGLRQHTGNWPGKTVSRAEGGFVYRDKRYKLVDLPGTYSLLSSSYDEEVARDFILFGQPDVTLIVVDASRLERNLNLVLQVLEITDRAIVCLNLMDEAQRRGLKIDERRLAKDLGVPVVATSARQGEGLDELNKVIAEVASGQIRCKPVRVGAHTKMISQAAHPIVENLSKLYPDLPNTEWVALRLLDGDERITAAFQSGELGLITQKETLLAADVQSPNGDALNDVAKDTHLDAAAADHLLERVAEIRWDLGPDYYQTLVEGVYAAAAQIADRAVSRDGQKRRYDLDHILDRIVTSRIWGIPLMALLLMFVFWLTIAGANVPSAALATVLLDKLHPLLKAAAAAIGMPAFLDGLLIDGMYLSTAWVVSVMLPPMAIFFPLFTLAEDFGYLPRVAFNLDNLFKRVGAHGKQALTMSMGFGCNAAGIVATRVIESPRERLIAIITNNFALCNGRWPTQILLATVFVGALVPAYLAGFVAALTVVSVALFGVLLTFVTSWILSRTVLRGEASSFSLELPPYRPPRFWQTIYTSLIDRTLFVLWRAIVFAMPAGAVIWLVGNISVADATLAEHIIGILQPFGVAIGLSGIILLAYVIAIPANEIVIPTVLMLIVLTTGANDAGHGAGVIFEIGSTKATGDLLRAGGFNLLMAVNLMLFSLVHNPCSTTIYTIWKETRSAKWTALAALAPVVMGVAFCFVVAQVWRAFGG